ncbi:pre-mRNA-processing factor 39 isoform X1 [Selaginella moellendorffii]|uniref:pre-mRNA-processing factor 39 isoform X1 n=1 Tax=Selaginella moellendorffii TaxID=88036 RepID=UPI000D1C7EEE|nr:pre-mRNA-processing factor 39 isoform X1 [Selaginella moellendorffii]XP_024539542.1 pre-mRNA-processing factor 39 isoform X1 [Selaginella moellendorffii]|eukprot:XP_024539541.1 pre-mRNA-processing factor 39 isoform X1 [Selaginella moellendorffii]
MEAPAPESSEANASEQVIEEEQAPKAEEVPVITPEERLWSVVKANPADFNAWTELIQETEKHDEIDRIRVCYDTFLAEFPLCYGYWKKYADFELRLGSPEKIIEVYERAVKAVAHSVDIWVHYCAYATEKFPPEEVIRLFERGVSLVGTDYLSHILWDKFIDYALARQDYSLLMQVRTRILEVPLQQLDRYFMSFKQFTNNRHWLDVRTEEKRHLAETLPRNAHESEKLISAKEAIYKKTKEWDAKIRDFENSIRRPYFHVKSLDDAQLANWHKYLDFVEKEADMQKVVKLFERCLIACANYPEYWIRYVEYLEKQNNLEMANDALHRATHIFVKKVPDVHIFAARFQERTGDATAARKTYKYISTELVPGHLDAIVKAAHFEMREGDNDAACGVFESAIEVEKAKEESKTLSLLYVQYNRFLCRIDRKSKAKEVLEAAMEIPLTKIAVEAAIYNEYRSEVKQLDKLSSLIQQATKAETGLAHTDREELSSLHLEFVDAFGDINAVMEAEYRHEGLFPFRKSYIDFKRRLAHDASFSDRAKLLKSSPAAMQAYGQQQWAAAYGGQSYPQNWQQQQAPQTAQWNAYAQQGYGYGSYTAYGTQQGQAAYSAYGTSQDMNGWTGTGSGSGSW